MLAGCTASVIMGGAPASEDELEPPQAATSSKPSDVIAREKTAKAVAGNPGLEMYIELLQTRIARQQ
jgi:hypothetical protein